MSLRERTQAKKRKSIVVTVDGDDYLVIGLSHLDRAKCFNEGRDKRGDMPAGRIELNLLGDCVCDPETQQPLMDWTEWKDVSSHITAPLISVIRECNGIDEEDLPKKHVPTGQATN
jgi:hypothetical protein